MLFYYYSSSCCQWTKKKKKKEVVWCHIKQVLIIFGSKLPFLNVFGSHLKTTIQKDNNHLSLGKSLIRFSTKNFTYFFNIFWRQILFQQQNHLQTKTTHKRVDSYRMDYNPRLSKLIPSQCRHTSANGSWTGELQRQMYRTNHLQQLKVTFGW